VPLTGYVSQAGVLDTKRAFELKLSDGVAEHFLAASPIERLPSVPGLLVHGRDDDTVPLEISEAFAAASGARLEVFDEGHFGHLEPMNRMWRAVVEWLAKPRPAGSFRWDNRPGGDSPAGRRHEA
jgi:pimeloyl-ACP methyl ester carboxylesterase